MDDDLVALQIRPSPLSSRFGGVILCEVFVRGWVSLELLNPRLQAEYATGSSKSSRPVS